MLDITFIKNNQSLVEECIRNKNLNEKVSLSTLLQNYQLYLDTLKLVETKRALRNKLTQDITKFLDQKHAYERQRLLIEAGEIKKDLFDLESKLSILDLDYKNLLQQVPNIYSSDTPVGKDETQNKVIKKWGELRDFDFEIKDHIEIGKLLDIIDIETASKVSGSRFYYLKNQAVTLQFALINFVLNTLQNKQIINEISKSVENSIDKVFIPILPPVFIRPDVMQRMDRLEPVDERYFFEKDNLVLVGSAEHTMGPMHMDTVFNESELPIRYIGYSTSFRRESGSYGKDVKGILRTHQFDKLEIEIFSTKEQGQKEQDLVIAIQEYLLMQLNIPYQVVQICTGDMGKPDYRQIDIECYIPSQNRYRETHTSDYMTDYQSRRLNTTYLDSKSNKHYVHMNDATAFAIGRILIAIIENNQQSDGSIDIPKVLTSFTGFNKIVPTNL